LTRIPAPSASERVRFARGPVLLLGLLLAACGPRGASTGERFTFAFSPPDGTGFIQHLKSKRVQKFAGAEHETQALTHESESATRFTIQKTESGYQVRAEEVSTVMTRNGEPVNDPVTKLLRAMPATYETDPEGRFLGIRGFENVSDRLASELPAELSSRLASVLTEETLTRQGMEEWNGRYGDLVGRTIEIGDVLASSREVDFAGGVSAVRYAATWFPEITPCDGRDCVRVRVFHGTELQALEDRLAKEIGKPARRLFDDITEPSSPGGFASEGEIDRLVDPATLLVQEETQRRTVTREIPMNDQLIGVLTINETKHYTFEYAPPSELRAERL